MADPVILQLVFLAMALPDDGVPDEKMLARRIREGDAEAFHSFFELHYKALFHFLLSKGIRNETAEDLIQQAFLYIWEHRSKIEPEKSLKAYLFSIAYSRMLNNIRDNKKFSDTELSEENTSVDFTPEDKIQHKELIQEVRSAIRQMPEKRSLVFDMCFMQEFTYRETAEAMGVSIKTVENHMGLAVKELRSALKNYTQENS